MAYDLNRKSGTRLLEQNVELWGRVLVETKLKKCRQAMRLCVELARAARDIVNQGKKDARQMTGEQGEAMRIDIERMAEHAVETNMSIGNPILSTFIREIAGRIAYAALLERIGELEGTVRLLERNRPA